MFGGTRRIADSVVGHDETARHAGAEIGFGFGQLLCIKDFDGDLAGRIISVFAVHFGHFFIVGRDPEGAAGKVFGVDRKLGGEFAPERLRVAGEGELGLGIVHHGEVAHARGGCSSADNPGFDNGDAQSGGRKFARAGRADNSRPHYNCIRQ